MRLYTKSLLVFNREFAKVYYINDYVVGNLLSMSSFVFLGLLFNAFF